MAIVDAVSHIHDPSEPVQMVPRPSHRRNAHVPGWNPALYQIENGRDISQTKLSNKTLTVVTISMLSVAGVLTVLAVATLSPEPCPTTEQKYSFTIVSTLSGFNNSKNHPSQPWPVMNVNRCSTVTIRLENQDASQAHGLAVALYANSGVVAGPGQNAEVSFVANRTGEFKMTCTIPCSIHPSMLNGYVYVS